MTRELGKQLADRVAGITPTATGALDWITAVLRLALWSKQREIVASVEANRATVVQSGNGLGKSFVAACLLAWWIATRPIGEAIVVATAPTSGQVDAILWAELRRIHALAGLPGTITRGEWRIDGILVALARRPADFIDAERAASTFQGIHRRFVLVVIDEASGIPEWLWNALVALTTGESARLLALGNPLDPASHFASICEPGSGWNLVHISVLDNPHFTGERVPAEVLEVLPGPTWEREIARQFGEQSGPYDSRVRGLFPKISDDGLIAASWVREAQEREFSIIPEDFPVTFSSDVARSGGDETIIVRLQEGRARVVHAATGHDLMRTTGEIVSRVRDEFRSPSVVVDATGLGSGVVDRLREQNIGVDAFNGASRATDAARFENRRAEAFWRLREALREGHLDLDPDDDVLAGQLLALRWKTNSRGRIQIESKDEMAKRGISSPDRADALAMAVGRRDAGPLIAFGTGPALGPDGRPLPAREMTPGWETIRDLELPGYVGWVW